MAVVAHLLLSSVTWQIAPPHIFRHCVNITAAAEQRNPTTRKAQEVQAQELRLSLKLMQFYAMNLRRRLVLSSDRGSTEYNGLQQKQRGTENTECLDAASLLFCPTWNFARLFLKHFSYDTPDILNLTLKLFQHKRTRYRCELDFLLFSRHLLDRNSDG